ncbi:hydroxymethylglutaryl-CoA synthase [Calditrichota bacterium GD2]
MQTVMKPERGIGIVGYGAYVPRYRIKSKTIAAVWRGEQTGNQLPVKQKSVPGLDEDTITMSIEAGQNALLRAGIEPQKIRAVWIGSESHPYAVKPSGTVVAQALGIAPANTAGDFEFACKAGTEAMQAAIGYVGSGMADYALAIGMDTAQGRPGDALEYTAAAGGAAFIMGAAENALAVLKGAYSYVTDTPDFFRRNYQKFPEHGNRFTGEPAYFHHIGTAAATLMEALNLKAQDFRFAVFHQPNQKFPEKIAAKLGFTQEQYNAGLLAPQIGNTYAGSAMLGLTAILDAARPGDLILAVSFGSGAGSDAFCFEVSEKIVKRRNRAPLTLDYIERARFIDYSRYARFRDKIRKS